MPKNCIYCGLADGPFKSVEHIIPESLGNHELVLPRGAVCDPCNNGPLSNLDRKLIEFEPIAMMKTMRGIPSKKNKLKALRRTNYSISRPKKGNVDITVSDLQVTPGTPHRFKSTFETDQRLTVDLARLISRSLLKQMLGLMMIDMGRKFVLQSSFDDLRRVVCGLQPHGGTLLLGRHARGKTLETASIRVTYDFVAAHGGPPMWVVADYFGLRLGTFWAGPDGRSPKLEDLPEFSEEEVVKVDFAAG